MKNFRLFFFLHILNNLRCFLSETEVLFSVDMMQFLLSFEEFQGDTEQRNAEQSN